MAPVVRDRKGEYKDVFEDARKKGFVRVQVDGAVRDLSETITLDKNYRHTIQVVVDRLVINQDLEQSRVHESLETAMRLAEGMVTVAILPDAHSGQRRGPGTAARNGSKAAQDPSERQHGDHLLRAIRLPVLRHQLRRD